MLYYIHKGVSFMNNYNNSEPQVLKFTKSGDTKTLEWVTES